MKIFIHILLLLVVVSTICICSIKPEMHKTVFLFDSAYQLVPETEVKVEHERIPIMEQPSNPKTETLKTISETTPVTKVVSKTTPKTTVTQPKSTIKTTKSVSAVSKPITTKSTKPVQTVKTTNQQQQKAVAVKPVKTASTVAKTVEPATVETKTVPTAKKVLTQQEENIAWNVWRSNLQNKIMKDTKLPPIPNGVVFKFTFTVDEYGKISNLQTWSENQGFTPYAIQYIAPVIRSYQGRSVLDFPEGTARKSTEVKGGWKISQNEKYSNPNDYNDIERVSR